jgi:hypothetical protein
MIYSCRSLGAVVVMYLQRISGELFYAYSSFSNSLLEKDEDGSFLLVIDIEDYH